MKVEILKPENLEVFFMQDMPEGSIGVIVESPITKYIGEVVLRSKSNSPTYWICLSKGDIWSETCGINRVRLLPKGTIVKLTVE